MTYGATDALSISGGLSLIPGLGTEQLFYAGTKFRVAQWEHGGAGCGFLVVTIPEDDIAPLGLFYGVTTLGNATSRVPLGLGLGYSEEQPNEPPLLLIGGETRLSERFALGSENCAGMDLDGGLISAGLRFLGSRMTVDVAFWTPLNSEMSWVPIPYIDFVFGI